MGWDETAQRRRIATQDETDEKCLEADEPIQDEPQSLPGRFFGWSPQEAQPILEAESASASISDGVQVLD